MRIQQRLTYANVVSTLCLVLLLIGGGTAYATLGKNTVGSPQIIDGSIKARDLGKGSVTTSKVREGAVTRSKIRNGAVTGAKVKDGSLSGKDLAPKATGMALAAATIAANGAVTTWFNRAGGSPSVNASGGGIYIITIPGVAPDPSRGIVSVTPVGSDRSCGWEAWNSTSFRVVCQTLDGVWIDHMFSVVVFRG